MLATSTEEVARNSQSVLESLQRSEISNPPAFGAKVAATILEDAGLRQSWFEDLRTMSGRIQSMRKMLYDGLVANCTLFSLFRFLLYALTCSIAAPGNWDHLLRQSGMFGFLGLSPKLVAELKGQYSLFLKESETLLI